MRQVKSDMAALEKCRLIQHTRRGRRESNTYDFLWHPVFEGEVQPTAPHSPDGEVQDSYGEVQPTALGEVQPTALESYPLNTFKESSSSVLVSSSANDDEITFSQNQNQKQNLDALISVARDQLRMTRATELNVPLEQVQQPDKAITVSILEAFSDYADFEVWLEGTVQRHVAQKARDCRWGLYLADAKGHAEVVAQQRIAAEQRAAEDRAPNSWRPPVTPRRLLRRRRIPGSRYPKV
jgi:hypothetical protein